MENQGKRLLLAVVLALGIVVLWNWLFPTKQRPKPPIPDGVGQQQKRSDESPVGIPTGASEVPVAAPGPEEVTTFDFPNLHVELSNRDARVVSWRLLDPKYARDWDKGEMVGILDHDTGTLSNDPVAGAFQVNFYKSPIVIPRGALWTKKADQDEQPNEATYTYESDDLRVVKVFHIHPDSYLLDLAVSVELKPGANADPKAPRVVKQQLAISIVGHQDPKAPTKSARTTRVTKAACLLNGSVRQHDAKSLEKHGPSEQNGELRWIGFNHPYLFFAVAPKQSDQRNLSCNVYPVPTIKGGMRVDLVYPTVDLSTQAGAVTLQVAAFIGPKHLSALEDADDIEGFSTRFGRSVDMGWFSIIARPLLSIMLWFHSYVDNWGIAIILLTLCVKLATLYWTTKSMRSMKAMAALKPKMDELQKKYGDDRAKQQQEMMALYKTHGVNPLSGCLPMLLQMPIWLALYRMLSSVGELYLAPFIPGWIDDLTATDPYHVLPIVLVGMMFLQSRMSPATVDNMQQKIMIYGLPLLFGVLSFFFPAGLTIYILTNTTLSLLHTLYMKKFDKGGKVVAAAAAAAKPAASKPGADRRPVVDVEAKEVVEDGEDQDDAADDGGDNDEDDEEPSPNKAAVQRQLQKSNAPRRKRRRKH